jgi:hypothetical protein
LLAQLLQRRLLRFHPELSEWDVLFHQPGLQWRLLLRGPELSQRILLPDGQRLRLGLSVCSL